jgi:hypothetical protein
MLKPLEDFFPDRRTLTREDFLRVHPAPLLTMPIDGAPADHGALRTIMMPLRRGAADPPAKPANLGVVAIAKRGNDAFQGFIWLGREPHCDVVVPFGSVSKLQAQFLPKPNGDFEIVDVGSTNGTFVAGARLDRNKPVALVNRQRIAFGTLEVTYVTPLGFWDELGERLGLTAR